MSKDEQITILDYYEESLDPKYNLKVHRVNKLIKEFNTNVTQLPKDKQIEYQNSIQRMCREILLAD